jgi:beta-hydroxylase
MKWLVIGAYLLSALYVHLRGRVRLPLARQLIDHSCFMAPINVFIYLCAKPPSTAFVPLRHLPELKRLTRHWQAIHTEADNLRAHLYAPAMPVEEEGAGGTMRCRLQDVHLKWYDTAEPLAQGLCPRTVALLQAIPSVKVASLVELPPGARLAPHRDPYAGFLRYHLGLATPNHDGCFIEVDGQRHAWRDGEAMLFDETYIHWAVNGAQSGQGSERLILLCDIERPMRWQWAQALNHILGRMFVIATNPPPSDTGPAGKGPHRVQGLLRGFGHYRRRFKSWNITVYRLTLAGLIAACGALLYML